jgi:hypothetical protein
MYNIDINSNNKKLNSNNIQKGNINNNNNNNNTKKLHKYKKHNNHIINRKKKSIKYKQILRKTKKHLKMTNNKDYTMLKNINGEWNYSFYEPKHDTTVDKSKSKQCMCINYNNMNDFKAYDRCQNNIVSGTDFCELHQDCKSYLRKFLSGYEPEYQPQEWANPYVEGSHNCYSYFLNRQVKAIKEKCSEICEKKHKKSCPKGDSECTDLKPQPGDFNLIKNTGSDKDKERIYQCPNMQYKILKDNPSLIPTPFNMKCPNKYYKGAMVVDPENTYHFYRNNPDGTFSHKPGISKISNVDAGGKTIYVPHFANRDYSDKNNDDEDAINYTQFCGYYCIPDNTYIHKNLA